MNSVLNPEAPEFHPNLTQVVQEGYVHLNKTIKKSNNFPAGASYRLFKTYTDFNVVTNQLSENVVIQSNQIITTEAQAVKLNCNDNEGNTEKIMDVNDSLLDRINVNIDTLRGANQPCDGRDPPLQIENPIKVSSWNKAPVIAKIKMGSTTFIGAKNIPRPQLNFKDTIDNSDSLWVPKISDKPNNIKPLALNILYNEKGEAVGYEHPYKVELDLYHPPVELIEPEPEPPYPPPLDQTPFTYVDTEEKLDELIKHLEDVSEIAVDVEHHSYRTYQGITCLIQITTHERGDFIIDALAIREHIHKLNLSFTDPKKLKVFHGAECDVVWLQRDFGVYIVGLFDTHQAARELHLHGLSLKYLLMRYCHVNADKKYQLADWRMRPLPEELIEYARLDTHYLLYIWKQMKRELLDLDGGQYRLHTVFENSRLICEMTYNKEVIHDDSHRTLYNRSKKSFNTQQMAALRMLYKWRDSQARELDESTTYLLPNHMLLTLAEILPREVQGVNACCSPMPPFVKQNVYTIHRIILTCRELPMEPQVFQMPSAVRTMLNVTQPVDVHIAYMHDFTHFPDYVDETNVDLTHSFTGELPTSQPDVNMFGTYDKNPHVLSDLNVEAKKFIPPYDRYRTYRVVAQAEEAKELQEKEARIAAMNKGNELIKQEVLTKLQEQQNTIEKEAVPAVVTQQEPLDNVEPSSEQEVSKEQHKSKKATQRKRKIIEKTEQKDTVEITENKKKEFNQYKINDIKKESKDSSIYKNIDYNKFYSETGLGPRLPKMKVKKS